MRVLAVVALFSVAVVVALFVLQRRSTHQTVAPPVNARSADVAPSDEQELDTTSEAQATDFASERAEVAGPPIEESSAQPALPHLRFAVVDARTLQPVEDIAIRVSAPKSDELASTAPFEGEFPFDVDGTIYAGGICELPEDLSCRGYQIEAPGYANQEGWIEDAARTPNGQTIRLERGGSISGRVYFDGKLASNVSARLRPALLGEPGARVTKGDLSDFLGIHIVGRLKDGELFLPDLSTGTYRLEIRGSHGVSLEIDRVAVVIGTDTSVGELRLASNPVVNGVVLFPEGRIPSSYKVYATCADHAATARVDSTGKFTIDRLPAGNWELDAPALEEFVCAGTTFVRVIESSAGQEITLDLRDRRGAWLGVVVRINGAPATGVRAEVDVHDRNTIWAPFTDKDGKTRAWLSAAGAGTVRVRSEMGVQLASRDLDSAPTFGDPREIELDIEAGELSIDCTNLSGFTELDRGSLWLDLASRKPGGVDDDPDISVLGATTQKILERYDWGFVPVGEYRATLVVDRGEPLKERRNSRYAKNISIRARALVEVRFTDADRVK